ncbi:hypothetical protein J8273_5342 [Carpediemonas membranifera]|uniref:Guanine nucleotide-binding protein subunit beta-like protein n=1 Tax=Carpediemonas membranifera TaxID=201153 RepID=A0A8J6B8R3_9EUKA|nr:hypothetical protein J8273_5342 [Carpediemonas membranifera]|eukprot:KAG9392352.1 hypothetical protein J8273_5342 [Carpediemonas membranifera]
MGVADFTRVLAHLLAAKVLPKEFRMYLTTPNLVIWMNRGELFASGLSEVDSLLTLWNARRGSSCVQTLKGHSGDVVAAMSGDTVVTTPIYLSMKDSESLFKLWDPTGKCRRTCNNGARVHCFAMSKNWAMVALCKSSGPINVYHVPTGELLTSLAIEDGGIQALAFSPDGTKLALGKSALHPLEVWDIHDVMHSECIVKVGMPPCYFDAVEFTADSMKLVTGGDQVLRVYDVATGRLDHKLRGHVGNIRSVACSPDGSLVASGSIDRTINIWHSKTWQCVQTLKGHAHQVLSVAFAPDGKTLASGSGDGTAVIWDTTTWQRVQTLSGHTRGLQSVAYSPNSCMLVTGSYDSTAKLWAIGRTAAFTAEFSELCSRSAAAADISLPSDDSPAFLSDLATLLLHFLTTGVPKTFEMRLSHPACTVFSDDRGNLVSDASDPTLGASLHAFNCRSHPSVKVSTSNLPPDNRFVRAPRVSSTPSKFPGTRPSSRSTPTSTPLY